MAQYADAENQRVRTIGDFLVSSFGRILIALIVPAVTFVVLWQGFIFLRDSNAPQLVITLIAIVWGVGGVAMLFFVSNWLIEQLPQRWMRYLQPFLFVGPAIAILTWYLAIPTLRTFWLSLRNTNGSQFVGLNGQGVPFIQNYIEVFTQRIMLEAFRNNLLWMVLGTSLTVILGLLVAVLADRSKAESIWKSLIFLPMAISFVGAGVIWGMVYEYNPNVGLLNAITGIFGAEPQAWLINQPWNNFFLIVTVIWLQSGYAMVLLSAALKGVPGELLEAARVDGANEIQIFFKILIPYIQGTIITVTTTVVIFTLKVFDAVIVMTGGQYGTEVIGVRFYRESFINRNSGYGSTIAIILLIAVIPVMIYNLKQFGEREVF
nr:sugar ABC transporter permease [Anaerolineae bacterium]